MGVADGHAYRVQGCKSVSSIGGDDQHILVTFDIGGMLLRFLFLMTFFSPFIVKIQLLGGCIPHPPGICSPDRVARLMTCNKDVYLRFLAPRAFI